MRLVLFLLGGYNLSWGLPAVIAPRWFFHNFITPDHRMPAAYPPYNEHLMFMLGTGATAFGVLFVLAGVVSDIKATRIILIGAIVEGALHLGYHSVRHGTLQGIDLAIALVVTVICLLTPLGLLVITYRRRPTPMI